ncbi:MAG: hypothetical protein J1F60_02060 [Oscillospiraceae bacterium]|nr:hypothetical protein [Oscillospiraceae bacterium]
MKIVEKITEFWNSHKDKHLFKGKILAAILLAIALIVNFTSGNRVADNGNDSNGQETAMVQQEKESPEREIHIGVSNVIALGVGLAALVVVKIKRDKDLNGRHDKIEKNKKED